MTGSSSTSPISKNIGSPTITATSAIAHGTSRGPARGDQGVDDPVGAAGLGEQLAQHRAERDEQADLHQRGADAVLEVRDHVRAADAGGEAGAAPSRATARGTGAGRTGDQHDDQRDAERRRRAISRVSWAVQSVDGRGRCGEQHDASSGSDAGTSPGQPVHDRVGLNRRGGADVDRQRLLVLARGFEVGELRVEQRRRHEVPVPARPAGPRAAPGCRAGGRTRRARRAARRGRSA